MDITLMHIRRATTEADMAEVAAMWTRSSVRLRRKGLDQWQYPVKWENIRRSASDLALWLAEDSEGRAVGTITVSCQPDHYWLPSDNPTAALYVHRMVIDDGFRGYELGSAMLDWAGRRARKAGKDWLRLDAWKSNPGLHRYYLDRGFSLVRIDTDPTDPSGACFQRRATVELGLGPEVVEA